MTDQTTGATLEEGATGVVQGEERTPEERASVLTPRHDARESALEAIASARRSGTTVPNEQSEEAAAAGDAGATTAKEGGEAPGGEQSTTEAAPAAQAADPNAELAAQLARQLAEGKLVLTDDLLAKTTVKAKIDGVEEEVPALKVLAQYQKNGAADVRLAEATRMSKEAADLLAKAQTTATAATTATTEAAATKQKEEVDANVARLTKEHAAALYNGDDEKAASLLAELVDARVEATLKSRLPSEPTSAVSVNDVVQQALPALKQQLSVESALTQLRADYPEIYADPDYALLADLKREELEKAGKPRAEAIAQAGEIIGQKFGIGKHKKTDAPAPAATTTRDQKLAAKAGLDEPTSAATRAPSTVQAPQTRSSVIAEMAASRGQARAP